MTRRECNRRQLLKHSALLGLAVSGWPSLSSASPGIHLRRIPSTGAMIPAIGMGSWLTFDVASQGEPLATRIAILRTFFERGGGMIDSSPMYGRSEQVIGECLQALEFPKSLFSATKVWTSGKSAGVQQMQHSAKLWQKDSFQLMQVHNLVDWKTHLTTLFKWKEQGKLDYVGITTYGGFKHAEMKKIMQQYPIDFVQLTYNIIDREAERELLPLAIKNNIAVIANRPFRGGSLFNDIQERPLPAIAKEIDCANWAQFFLKFILAHPAITCAIPATSQVAHMEENMGALLRKLPTLAQQKTMAEAFYRV